MIQALYEDPSNEILLTEYLLQTGQSVQLGLMPAGAGGFGYNVGGDPGTGEPPPRCFAGEVPFTLFNSNTLPMAELYERRREFIGKGARSFTNGNIIVPGEIRDIYKTTVFALMHAIFDNDPEPLRVKPNHRFWLPRGRSHPKFREIRRINRKRPVSLFDGEWRKARLIDKQMVEYPEGVDVYNCEIGIYHDYFARNYAVSNAKPLE